MNPSAPTPPESTTEASAPTVEPKKKSGARRALRWIGRGLLALLLVVLILVAGLWWWTGTDGSLAALLQRAAGFMPAGQTLSSSGVTGSVRTGGRIGQLRYESPTLSVQVDDVDVGWQLAPLLDRQVKLGTLHAKSVTIASRPAVPPKPDAPLEPLTELKLPVGIDLPFQVDRLVWTGPPETIVTDLAGRYRYVGGDHRLDIDGVDVAGGHYSAQATVQGAAPMAVDAVVDALIAAPMSEGVAPMEVKAHATIKGTLSGTGARLAIAAHAQSQDSEAIAQAPATPAGSTRAAIVAAPEQAAQALRVSLDAALAPWAPQPVLSAKAALSHLDVARLVAGAPRTDVSGTVNAGPLSSSDAAAQPSPRAGSQDAGEPAAPASTAASTLWQASIALSNAIPGPYDAQRVPVEQVDAEARYDGRRWSVPKARVALAGGSIEAAGQWAPSPDPWEAEARVEHVDPAQLHTALAAAPINGTVRANQQGDTITFGVDLKGDATAVRTKGRTMAKSAAADTPLRFDRIQLAGTYADNKIDLPTLLIEAENAKVAGRLQADIAAQAGTGKLAVDVPGVKADIDADMAPERGKARVELALADAAKLQKWIEKLPGLEGLFAGATLAGNAKLDARWQGGWKAAQRQVETGRVAANDGVRLDATLTAPTLDITLPAPAGAKAIAGAANSTPVAAKGTAVQLRDVELGVAGTAASATLDLTGRGQIGTQKVNLSTRARGGLAGPDLWRMAIDALRVDATDTTKPNQSPWALALAAPLDLTLRRPASAAGAASLIVDASAGSATLAGPAPGTARVTWQPVHFEQRPAAQAGGAPVLRVQSRGSVTGLPLAWAQALAGEGANAGGVGVTGDLVFGGDWDIDLGSTLRARARLARTSGDLRVLAGGAAVVRRIDSRGTGTASETKTDAGGNDAPSTPAGLRVAELTLDASGTDVKANLKWDSARAGTIDASASTRLTAQDGGWTIAPNAPLAGQVKASVPDIGVWAVLAPPGWRIQGTLGADVSLAGTLDAPQWRGTLTADQLSVKAAVEGIDLRNGRLRATLDGNRLQLNELRLEGGPANGARIGGQSGNLSTVASEQAQGGGSLTASGSLAWGAAGAATESALNATLNVDIQRLRVLARTDRQASVSGQLQIGMVQGQVTVRGNVKTDRASIVLPDGTAPSLDSDVVVTSAAIRREQAAKADKAVKAQVAAAQADAADEAARAGSPRPVAPKPPDIDVTFNLGDDFALQGQGITTRLAGEVQIRSNAGTGGQPRLFGEVRTVKGQYRAYGQELDVEQGIVRFNGPYANPALEMLAVRPNIDVRAGVRITGTAQAPRVRLYSDPPLPDAEALSWVVLGRPAASGGAEALVMQQAALALIGGLAPGGGSGNFASRLGLDEIGFKGPGDGGSTSDAAITLGKRLSRNIYLSYERSLSGTLGTLYIFYELTKQLKLRAETGTSSGLDIVYTISYD